MRIFKLDNAIFLKERRILPAFFILFLIFNFNFALPRKAEAAFGISPPFLNADHLVPGARYVQTVYLVRDIADEDLLIRVTLSLDERIKPWISVNKGLEFVIPAGTRQFPVEVAVQVPKGAGLGIYRGNISFTSAPAEAGQVTIALGAQMSVNLTVGDDIFQKYSIPLIKFMDIEEGWNPRVFVKFMNEGNVPEKLDGASFELFDQFNATRLAFSQSPKELPETPPFEIKEYIVEFPVDFHLGRGQYWGNVVFYKNNEVVATQKTVFNVLEAGSLGGSPFSFDSITKNWQYFVAGGILLILFIFGVLRKWKKRRA